jgi:hypothetical protein
MKRISTPTIAKAARLLSRGSRFLSFGLCIASLILGIKASAQTDRSPNQALTPAPLLTPNTSSQQQKKDLVSRLRELESRQNQILIGIDNMMRRKLQETTGISLATRDQKGAETRLQNIADSLEELDARRSEFAARRDFIDTLIFQVDSKWGGQTLQVFVEHQLLDLAANEFSSMKTGPRIWKFLTYLSVAIREIPEPQEDLVSFIDGYMSFATVLDPKTPIEYLASRAYSNGIRSSGAKAFDRDKLGDGLDQKLKLLKARDELNQSSMSASTGKAPAEPKEPKKSAPESAPGLSPSQNSIMLNRSHE